MMLFAVKILYFYLILIKKKQIYERIKFINTIMVSITKFLFKHTFI